jgi:hypothetical protein
MISQMRNPRLILQLSGFITCSCIATAVGQDDTTSERAVIQIKPQEGIPTVRAIAPVDKNNVFFLNNRGQIGVAKFSPGLSLIGWEYYSEVKLNSLPFLAAGPEYSVVTGSPDEITQAFDTDGDVELCFYQALIRDWVGRSEGVTITAGPVADPFGRLLFALSPHLEAPEEVLEDKREEEENTESPEQSKPKATPKARIVSWTPGAEELVTLTESRLPISSFSISRGGLLACLLSMPGYDGGYYVSLTQLPAPPPEAPATPPQSIPFTLPSLLIPAELTRGTPPTQLAFCAMEGKEKLLALCPGSKQIIEIVPESVNGTWQGSILLNRITKMPIEAVVEIAPGAILAGGDSGFIPLDVDDDTFKIKRVAILAEGISLDFTDAVNRAIASKPENYAVRAISLNGENAPITVRPVIESDGRSVILRTSRITEGTVIQVTCPNVVSENGASLLSSAVYYTVHQRAE